VGRRRNKCDPRGFAVPFGMPSQKDEVDHLQIRGRAAVPVMIEVEAGCHRRRVPDRPDPPEWPSVGRAVIECARGPCDEAVLTFGDLAGVVGLGLEGVGIRGRLPGAALGSDLLGRPLSGFTQAPTSAPAEARPVSISPGYLRGTREPCQSVAGEFTVSRGRPKQSRRLATTRSNTSCALGNMCTTFMKPW
jgi:hypothetical protein